MTVQGEATRITLLVTQTLERLGIPCAVGGSLASTLYGTVRTTQDSGINNKSLLVDYEINVMWVFVHLLFFPGGIACQLPGAGHQYIPGEIVHGDLRTIV